MSQFIEYASGERVENPELVDIHAALDALTPKGRGNSIMLANDDWAIVAVHYSAAKYSMQIHEKAGGKTLIGTDTRLPFRSRSQRRWWQFWKALPYDFFSIEEVRQTFVSIQLKGKSPEYLAWVVTRGGSGT